MPQLPRRASLALIVFLGSAVTACSGNGDVAERAQRELVGRSTTQLFACAGTPDRKIIQSKQSEEVSYFSRRDGSGFLITATRYEQGDKGGGPGFCHAVVDMFTGVVQKVRYVDADGDALKNPKRCAIIVADCIAEEQIAGEQ